MTIVIWKCKNCLDVRASSSLQHHRMDICKCDSSGMDLETYGNRVMGFIDIIEVYETGILRDMAMSMNEQGYVLYEHFTLQDVLEEERESYERQYKD